MSLNEYSQGATEVLDILKNIDEEELECIPLDFIKRLNKIKDDSYVPQINYTIPLEENNLKKSTKAFLTLIYRDYLSTEDERKELEELLDANEEKIREKYSVNLFEDRVKSKVEESLTVIPKHQNFFQRIINKLFKKSI